MQNSHEGRTSLVAGAASGFGRAITVGLARRGADVVAVDLAPSDETVREVVTLGRKAVSIEVDVSDPDADASAAEPFNSLTGCVDILVNNAGVLPFLRGRLRAVEADAEHQRRPAVSA